MELEQIQGNIIGFNKHFQHFLFLQFEEPEPAREWLKAIIAADQVTSAGKVIAFRAEFNDFRRRLKAFQEHPNDAPHPGEPPTSTWLNLACTYAGLQMLAASTLEGMFPTEFVQGMAKRADILGDVGGSAPSEWEFPKGGEIIHAMMIIAADSEMALDAAVKAQCADFGRLKIHLVKGQRGCVIEDALGAGTDHFGFRDGISQPGFRGENLPETLQKGGDLIWPGEFVLGYRRQNPEATDDDGTPNGPIAVPSPAWTKNGSYLVFRRLKQDVQGFSDFVKKSKNRHGLSPDLFMAKLIGRYRSGAPLAALTTPGTVVGANRRPQGQATDPGLAHPGLLEDSHINDFDFKGDPDGRLVPSGAHIRRLHPRDLTGAARSFAQTKRILRRAIPYVESGTDKGLLFVCYQRSILDQYEFLQQSWANDPYFPAPGKDNIRPGRDPLIGNSRTEESERNFNIPGTKVDHVTLMKLVTMTGGDYFFSPSKQALCDLVRGEVLNPDEQILADAAQARAEATTLLDAERQRIQIQRAQLGIAPQALNTQVVPMPASAITGAGDCKLQVTVAFNGLDPAYYYPWRMWVRGKPLWASQQSDFLVPNSAGFATGTMWMWLLRLLEAFDPDLTVGQIVRARWNDEPPSEVLGAYVTWEVELITRTEQVAGPGKIAAPLRKDAMAALLNGASTDMSGWTDERIGEFFPVDMHIGPP